VRKSISSFIAWLVVILALLWVYGPLYWLVRTSFMRLGDTHQYPPYFWPPKFTLENFRHAPERVAVGIQLILGGMKNSLVVAVANALICIGISLLAAYSIVRFKTGGSHLSFWILSNQFLPPVAFLVPIYLIFKLLGLYGTHMGLIIAYLLGNIPFAVWILMGFLQEIPGELDEAAVVDGASPLQIVWRIIFPLMTPAIAVVFVFTFVACWNEYLFAFLLSGPKWDTLPVIVPKLRWGNTLDYPQIAAASFLSVIPGIIFATVFHRYLVRGLTFGAVKE
jgi:multiple sugar transport system permease protein